MSITDIAMDEAVAHWERLSKCRTREEVRAEGFTYKECSFCKMFLKHSCKGCPVALRTGATHCDETPYPKVWRELNSFLEGCRKIFPLEEVLAELYFLKSLRSTNIAIDDAVEHWTRLSKCKTVAEVKAEGFHWESCSLCELFFDDGCRGCPIAERTGATYCQETPYEKAEKELCNFIKEYRGTFPRKAVMAELHFIESLRKKA